MSYADYVKQTNQKFKEKHGVFPYWFRNIPEHPDVHRQRCVALISLINKHR